LTGHPEAVGPVEVDTVVGRTVIVEE